MTSSIRRTAAAGTVVLAVLLGSTGCQSRANSAAIIGDHAISVSTLHDVFTRQYDLNQKTAAGGAQAQTQPGPLEQQTLSVLIQLQLLRDFAASHGVRLSQGDIDTELDKLKSGTGGAFNSQIPAEDQRSYAEYTALIDTLSRKYSSGGRDDTLTLKVMQVKDAKTAAKVVSEIQADPSKFDQIAKTQGTQMQDVTSTPVSQLPPQLATATRGQVIVVPNDTGSGPFVVYVLDRNNQTALLKQLEAYANSVHVKVNPRFGTWNSAKLSVVDASGGPVVTKSPAGQSSAGQG